MCDSPVLLYDTNLLALAFDDLLGTEHLCSHFFFPMGCDHFLFCLKKNPFNYIYFFIFGEYNWIIITLWKFPQ